MRKFENIKPENEASVKRFLNVLIDPSTGVDDYRMAFYQLGFELGKILACEVIDINHNEMMLVCASEDVDWLAQGVEMGLGKGEIPLSVFWNTRSTVYKDDKEIIEITPIIKSYEEPIVVCKLLIVAKSIISSSCVVKTQLTRLIGKLKPEKIAILAPVMYKDGKPNLEKEFPAEVSNKFHFITFAVDDTRNDSGEVDPGIGGMIYPKLGLGDMEEKNHYIPQKVLKRI